MATSHSKVSLLFSTALVVSGCAPLAIATAPAKRPVHDASAAAQEADATFWATLHGGAYDEIGPALDKLEGAYLAHPEDPRTAAHIGFLHVWRAAERARKDDVGPTITDDFTLARRYFREAVALDPDDARFRGFLAGMTLAEGTIHHDERLKRVGFFEMKDAVDSWPEFNLFTRGYTMSRLPFDDSRYADALKDQWDNLDLCADGAHVDRHTGNFAPYMRLETHEGVKRACWNSWTAPHNLEGFFLNMGDMIVKSGDPGLGRRIYAQARLAREFGAWPYRDVLERRIAQADENVALFRAPTSATANAKANADKERRMMVDSPFGCTGCHQQ